MKRLKVEADREVCIGAGMCAFTAPEIFDQDDEDGRVVVLANHAGPDVVEAARQAVTQCPSGAISLHETEEEST